MADRHKGKFPPPPDGIAERRQQFRREDDMESHEIADRAVSTVSIVRKLSKTSIVSAIVGAVMALLASAGATIGMSIRGPRQELADVATLAARRDSIITFRVDTNVARIAVLKSDLDSTRAIVAVMAQNIAKLTIIACIQVQRQSADMARLAGCNESRRDP